jgi:hypothetical protein
MVETTSRRFILVRFSIIWNINNSRSSPDVHSRPHHLLRDPIKAARLNTNSRCWYAVLGNGLMHQPRATFSAEEAFRFAIRIGAYIYGDGTRKWRKCFEGWEDSGHAVGG